MCFSVTILFLIHTECHGLSRVFSLCPELSNFSFSHGVPRIITVLSLCPELSNYRIFLFHTEFHGESRIYISYHELSNYRIFLFTRIIFMSRIIELSNFFSHGVPRRITDLFFCHEFANSKIRDKENPWSSVTLRVKKKNRDSP